MLISVTLIGTSQVKRNRKIIVKISLLKVFRNFFTKSFFTNFGYLVRDISDTPCSFRIYDVHFLVSWSILLVRDISDTPCSFRIHDVH